MESHPSESILMQPLKKIFADTRAVFRTRWIASELIISPWVINAIIYITIFRSLSYGIELLFIVAANPISPLMAFAAIFGIQVWGILMIVSVLVLLIGVLTKRSLFVTIGTLLCSAVWTGFALCLGFGWMNIGSGGRFFIASAATAATWFVFFLVQLKSLRKNGVGND